MLPRDIISCYCNDNNNTCFTKTLLCIQLSIFLVILMSYTLPSASLITGWSNQKYAKIGEQLTINWWGKRCEGLEDIFSILKKKNNHTQFACSQINILYLSNYTLINIPNSRAAKKQIWRFRVLGGSNRKQLTFWRKYECTKIFNFYQNLLNTWKCGSGKITLLARFNDLKR